MRRLALILTLSALLLGGCQSEQTVCTWGEDQVRYIETPPPSVTAAGPAVVQIGNREVRVDQLVSGPLCDAHWSGTVYVDCGVQVLRWAEQPLFLQGCDFTVEPGTVVYVAYHNNAAYYNGCSCHTGEVPPP